MNRMHARCCENAVIRTLPPDVLAAFVPRFEEVVLKPRSVLYEVGDHISRLYFPQTGVISLFTTMSGADPVENGMIGPEGAVGTIALAGVPAFTRARVQIPGRAVTMSTETFFELYALSDAFRTAILQFNAALISHIQQNVACNILHDAKQRICRWLLHATDRMATDQLLMTQETLAASISAHRATIIAAIAGLKDDGIVDHGRGKLKILDRERLLQNACDCYERVQQHTRAMRH